MPTDADLYARLLQNYQDLAARVTVLREAVEQTFGVKLPSALTMDGQFEVIVRTIYAVADRPRTASIPANTDDTPPHFPYRIDRWTDDGENIMEHLAGVEDFAMAKAAYRAACQRWPNAPITLRQGARVVENSRRGRTVRR